MDSIVLAAISASPVVKFILGLLLFLVSVFMILLVLVQRGRGGGLAGALGGAGGQSAFGTKAGDAFTRITIGVAVVWMFLSMLSIHLIAESPPPPAPPDTSFSSPAGKDAPGDKGDADSSAPAKGPGVTIPTEKPADSSATVPAEKPADPPAKAPEAPAKP